MSPMKCSRLCLAVPLTFALLSSCIGTRIRPTPTLTPPVTTATVVTPTTVAPEPSGTADPKAKPGAPGIGDSLFPTFGNGGYDVQHYTLDLTVNDVHTSDLAGITTIQATATQSLSSFNLDFIGFEITDVKINGQSVEFKRRGQELTITPSAELIQDESFTVEIRYEGSPSARMGWITFEKGSFVLGEPTGASSFYPVNEHPLDKAAYTLRVTVPEPYEVAANGVLVETTDQGDINTFVFEAPDPMASYLVTINIDEFDIETAQTESGVQIRNYYPTGSPENVGEPFERQDEMIEYFSDLFGAYPFEAYGAVVIDTKLGVALETQTLSIFGMEIADPNEVGNAESVVAHELAHQWFGDSVSLADWSDLWLNESFATYAQGLWMEHVDGRATLDAWIREVYGFVRERRDSMTPPGETTADRLFNAGVYYWGALGLHALRLEVGDETFFEILKTYHEQYKGGNARTADFIAVAEEVSGKELSSFFDDWLYSEELAPIPDLGLEP